MRLIVKIIFVLFAVSASGQEYIGPLNGNINLIYRQPSSPLKNSYLEKTAAAGDTIPLPFFEDFSYAPDSPYPTGKYWKDSSVYVNSGFAIAPLSIGVATFDGLAKNGYPYNINGNSNMSTAADSLTSKPIALGFNGTGPSQISDSIGFSFFYQHQGYGNSPETNDSLVVEFFKPLAPVVSGTNTIYGQWSMVWSARGTNSASATGNDSTFKRMFIRIVDTAYLHNGFRFRIRNKATPTGNVDHWNVDYIRLSTNFQRKDTTYTDAAFGYIPKMPWLKNYSSMPWWQFNASETDTAFSNYIRNNGDTNTVFNLKYKYDMYSATNTLLYSKDLGSSNVKPFYPYGWDKVSTHKNPGCTFTLSSLSDSTHFLFRHYIDKITNDLCHENDTVNQRIVFNNYYAYDDGSAELGYGIMAYGAKTALKYSTNVYDTLRAIDIFFNPTLDGNLIQASGFRLCVWQDAGSQPGNIIIRDSIIYPKYLKVGYNQSPRYFLTSPLTMNPGTYYFGLQQVTSQTLSIGLDRNYDTHTKLYFDATGNWQQSTVNGSLMIHPVFGHAGRAMIGINEPVAVKQKGNYSIQVYPNPVNDRVFIGSDAFNSKDKFGIEIWSVIGTKIAEKEMDQALIEINLNDQPSGIYFVKLRQNGQTISSQKFIIAR
jgi:hypothetical protein